MVFYKKVEVREMRDKYGGTQRGLFAQERIAKGEKVWFCECTDKDGSFTRKQLLNIIKKHPRLDYFVRSFSYMIDDDLYAMPMEYLDEKNNDECALFNHSCMPNCGFIDEGFGDNVVAVRDIEPGDELTYHYGLLETEASLIYGLKCECRSENCCQVLTFDYYRDPEFVDAYFTYMTPYLRQKVLDMKHRWYSRDCFVKRIHSSDGKSTRSSPTLSIPSSSSSCSLSDSFGDDNDEHETPLNDVEQLPKGLFTLRSIKKGEQVAEFSSDEPVQPNVHYLRHSETPNCELRGRKVFTTVDVPEDTELTVYYHGILL